MINKSTLQSIIAKYYLNGLNNQVKWRIKDKQLVVYAGDKGRVCKVQLNNFDFEDAELGIFDTNKLNKLISITNGDLLITPEKIKALYAKIHISDSNYDLTYSLADTLILGKVPYYNDAEQYEVELKLDYEIVDKLISG